MNDLPTVFEVVSGTVKKQSKEKSSISNNGSSKTKSNPSPNPNPNPNPNTKSTKYAKPVSAKEDDEGLDEEEEDEHGDTLCGACGENYASDEFWICCDLCERWFHGKCVKITPAKAEHIKQYKCPNCNTNKRARP
ncbi:hypothetical protein KSS87_012693 [Heliosperma pusillum]|nr:hypothetical protein KSS87_012693 [Heliosperma pusillum]